MIFSGRTKISVALKGSFRRLLADFHRPRLLRLLWKSFYDGRDISWRRRLVTSADICKRANNLLHPVLRLLFVSGGILSLPRQPRKDTTMTISRLQCFVMLAIKRSNGRNGDMKISRILSSSTPRISQASGLHVE